MQTPFSHQVPKFGLYGEYPGKNQPEFVHIEKISDRSSKNDWTIKPHRHGQLFQILFLFGGSVTVQLDETHRQLNGNWAICIPPGTVHGFSFPTGTDGEVLTIEMTLLNTTEDAIRGYLQPLMNQPQVIQFSSSTVLFNQVRQYLELVRNEFGSTETHYTQALSWLVKIILLNLVRQRNSRTTEHSASQRIKRVLLTQFKELLETHYREHWKVRQYARALHTSTSSLNRLCTEYLGITTKQVIQDRLLVEIKRRLIYTRESIDNVAFSLGFKDPSYFSRVFKRLAGESPSTYRQRSYHNTETTAVDVTGHNPRFLVNG